VTVERAATVVRPRAHHHQGALDRERNAGDRGAGLATLSAPGGEVPGPVDVRAWQPGPMTSGEGGNVHPRRPAPPR
jgi:hypothetical protein